MEKSLILASASPRRLELLSQLGIQVTVNPADIDETVQADESAVSLVQRLAVGKACALGDHSLPVLGADTVVSVDNCLLGKPCNKSDAINMLLQLSDKIHQVVSGVCVRYQGQTHAFTVSTDVTFGVIDLTLANWYWETGEPEGKAGAYGIQGKGARFVAELKGSYSNVVGLPLYETAQLLTRLGLFPENSGR